MEIYLLILLLIVIANLGPLLSSMLNRATLESISNSDYPDEKKQKFIELKEKLSDSEQAFFIFEFIVAITSILIFSRELAQNSIFEIYFEFVIIYLLIRFLFITLGRNLSSYSVSFYKLFRIVYYFSLPFIFIINKFETMFGAKFSEEASREELNALVEEAMEDGALDAGEYRILKNIMHFKKVYVSDVMTPRTVIFSVSENEIIEKFLSEPESQLYSRIPIWEGDSLDEGISGYIMTKDVMREALKGNSKLELKRFKREIYFIPENAELDIALNMFLQRRQHIFMVVDEYGGIEGLITMEDVLETILGAEIVDEADKVVDLRELAKNLRDKRIAAYNKSENFAENNDESGN